MKYFKLITLLVAISLLSACAGQRTQQQFNTCMIVTTLAGGAAGTVAGGVGGVVGAAGGIAVGSLICREKEILPVDSDGDGVVDPDDRCPGTPSGISVDIQGCPIDSDSDGVADYQDKCPGTPAGADVNSHGCPLDSDNDGVADYLDKCPGTSAGVEVDTRGCPLPDEKLLVIENVQFGFDSATLLDETVQLLTEAVAALKQNSGVGVDIEGHTDSRGPEIYNQQLSERRANSVRDYLISQGIDAGRLTAVGKGESTPLASNDSKNGRSKNRRVEFVVR